MAPPPEKKTLSMRSTLMLWLAPVVILVGIASIVANIHLQSRQFENQVHERAVDVADDLAAQLSLHIWNMDEDAIARYFINYPWAALNLVSVKIATEYGDQLYDKTYTDEPTHAAYRRDVHQDGRLIGSVEVDISEASWTDVKQAITHTGIIVVGSATLAILLVSNLIVSLVVANPVKRTVSELRNIASGDYSHELPNASTSEMQLINQEVNIMANEIAQRQSLLEEAVDTREKAEEELRQLNEKLEAKIQTRTIQLRRLAQMLTAAQDDEQRRIAEGLHDDVAQLLAASRMKIALASMHAPDASYANMMTEIDAFVEQAYERLRLLSFELASSTLYQWGLRESLQKLCEGMNERFGVSFTLTATDDIVEMDDTTATLLFKSAREILFNVIKHSGVIRARVCLDSTPDSFILFVEDEGKGFAKETDIEAGHGLGLFSIRERIEDIDGEVQIESKPGLTRVSLIVPKQVESLGNEAVL